MKCPKCESGKFILTHYEKGASNYKREKAILQCNKCGHKEVFGR